jgi:hypothetical protein
MTEQSLQEICLSLYERGGQFAVEDYILERHPEQEWGWCLPCDNEEPLDNEVCLVCGTLCGEEA